MLVDNIDESQKYYVGQKKQYKRSIISFIWNSRRGKTMLQWQKANQWLLEAKDRGVEQKAWGKFVEQGPMLVNV